MMGPTFWLLLAMQGPFPVGDKNTPKVVEKTFVAFSHGVALPAILSHQ